MFRFFKVRKWLLWAWAGSFAILSSLWVQVQIDVKINEWFGQFYDMIQKALGEPNAITIEEYWRSLFDFISLAGTYVAVAVVVSYFTSHFLFRWRTAMVEWYHSVYDRLEKLKDSPKSSRGHDQIQPNYGRIRNKFHRSNNGDCRISAILLGLSIGIPIFFFGDWEYGLL